MKLADMAARFSGVRFNPAKDAFIFLCPACGGQAIATVEGGRIKLECGGGCTADQILSGPRRNVDDFTADANREDVKQRKVSPVLGMLDSTIRGSVSGRGLNPQELTASQDSQVTLTTAVDVSENLEPPFQQIGDNDQFVDRSDSATGEPRISGLAGEPRVLRGVATGNGAISLAGRSASEPLSATGTGAGFQDNGSGEQRSSHEAHNTPIPRSYQSLSTPLLGREQVIAHWQGKLIEVARNLVGEVGTVEDLAQMMMIDVLKDTAPRYVQRPAELKDLDDNELEGIFAFVAQKAWAEKPTDLIVYGNGPPPALRALDAETFFRETEHLENIRWRWDRLAPSCGLIGIFGDPEAGKSTFSRTLALALASGADCLGRSCLASRVLYLDLAGETVSHRRAFKKLGWTGAEMKLVSTAEYLAGDPRSLQVMGELFLGERIEVVFVDMMADLLNFKDLNDYANAKETMSKLRRLAVATNTLVIVLHHTPKALPPDADVLKAGLGSQAIVGSFDLRIAIRRRAKGLATISMSKGKLGGESLDGEWVIGCDPETEKIELRNNWREAMKDFYGDKIFELLAQDVGTRMGATAIAEALILDASNIRGALSKLVRDAKIEREGKGKRGDGFRYWVTDAQQAIYGKVEGNS